MYSHFFLHHFYLFITNRYLKKIIFLKFISFIGIFLIFLTNIFIISYSKTEYLLIIFSHKNRILLTIIQSILSI